MGRRRTVRWLISHSEKTHKKAITSRRRFLQRSYQFADVLESRTLLAATILGVGDSLGVSSQADDVRILTGFDAGLFSTGRSLFTNNRFTAQVNADVERVEFNLGGTVINDTTRGDGFSAAFDMLSLSAGASLTATPFDASGVAGSAFHVSLPVVELPGWLQDIRTTLQEVRFDPLEGYDLDVTVEHVGPASGFSVDTPAEWKLSVGDIELFDFSGLETSFTMASTFSIDVSATPGGPVVAHDHAFLFDAMLLGADLFDDPIVVSTESSHTESRSFSADFSLLNYSSSADFEASITVGGNFSPNINDQTLALDGIAASVFINPELTATVNLPELPVPLPGVPGVAIGEIAPQVVFGLGGQNDRMFQLQGGVTSGGSFTPQLIFQPAASLTLSAAAVTPPNATVRAIVGKASLDIGATLLQNFTFEYNGDAPEGLVDARGSLDVEGTAEYDPPDLFWSTTAPYTVDLFSWHAADWNLKGAGSFDSKDDSPTVVQGAVGVDLAKAVRRYDGLVLSEAPSFSDGQQTSDRYQFRLTEQAGPDASIQVLNPDGTSGLIAEVIDRTGATVGTGQTLADGSLRISMPDAPANVQGDSSDFYTLIVRNSNGLQTRYGLIFNLELDGINIATVLDRSGSMSGANLTSMQDAAAQFVRLLDQEDALGIASFADSSTVDMSLLVIGPDETVRNQAINVINSISASGSTNIGSGLISGGNILSAASPESDRAIVLLSDGEHNSGPSPLGAIPAGIPVFTIAFGSGADRALLRQIAEQSGGQFLDVPDPAAIRAAFEQVSGSISGESEQFRTVGTVQQNQTLEIGTTTVDPSDSEMRMFVSFPGSDLDFVLTAPDGRMITKSTTDPDIDLRVYEDATSESFVIRTPMPGEWQISLLGVDTEPGGEPFEAFARLKSDVTGAVTVPVSQITRDNPLPVSLKLGDTIGAIDNATVRATITFPGGGTETITLNDNGLNEYIGEFSTLTQLGSHGMSVEMTGLTNDGVPFSKTMLDSIDVVASVDVSGSHAGIWSTLQSPYNLTSDVYVESGTTLTIDPGVVVTTNSSSYEIIVREGGRLIIGGEIGADLGAEIIVEEGGAIEAENSVFRAGGIIANGTMVSFTGNDFTAGSLEVGPEVVPQLNGNQLPETLFIDQGVIDQAVDWDSNGVLEYRLTGDVTVDGVDASLSLDPSAVLTQSSSSYELIVANGGSVFTRGSTIAGEIHVGTNSPGLLNAANSQWNDQGSLRWGQYATGTLAGSEFDTNAEVYSAPDRMDLLNANTLPSVVYVLGGTIAGDVTWSVPASSELRLTSDVYVSGLQAGLTIAPGVTVSRNSTSYQIIAQNGSSLTVDDVVMNAEIWAGFTGTANLSAVRTQWGSSSLLQIGAGFQGVISNNVFAAGAYVYTHPEKVPRLRGNDLPNEIGILDGRIGRKIAWDLDGVDVYRLRNGDVTVSGVGAELSVKPGSQITRNSTGYDFFVHTFGSLVLEGVEITGDVVLQSSSSAQITNVAWTGIIDISSSAQVVIRENDLSNATIDTDGSPLHTIDLSRNFWGTSDVGVIKDKINDRDDNSNLPLVVVEPLVQSGDIVGRFWNDTNGNNRDDRLEEDGRAGVTVRLRRSSNNQIVATATTDSEGYYQFSSVADGQYYLSAELPADLRPVAADVGDDLRDSDFSPANLRTGAFQFDVATSPFIATFDGGVRERTSGNHSTLVGFVNGNWWMATADSSGNYANHVAASGPASSFRQVLQGDFNDDGIQDLAAWLHNREWRVGIGDGNGQFTFSTWTEWAHPEIKEVHVGDFNNDGLDDIIGLFNNGNRGRWWVAQSDGSRFMNRHWGDYGNYHGIETVLVGNFDGLKGDDLTVVASSGVVWMVKTSNTRFQYLNSHRWNLSNGFEFAQVGNFNGDTRDDVLAVFGTGTQRHVFVAKSTGPATGFYSSNWSDWTVNQSLDAVVVGDFDGDGRDNVAGLLNGTRVWFGESNGQTFTMEHWLRWNAASSGLQSIAVGDSNGDGLSDIFGRAADGMWHAAESTGNSFVDRELVEWSSSVQWRHVRAGRFVGTPSTAPSQTSPDSISTVIPSFQTKTDDRTTVATRWAGNVDAVATSPLEDAVLEPANNIQTSKPTYEEFSRVDLLEYLDGTGR